MPSSVAVRILVLLVALSLLNCASLTNCKSLSSEVLSSGLNSIAVVFAFEDEPSRIGTGFFVSSHSFPQNPLFFTAAHGVGGSTNITYAHRDSDKHLPLRLLCSEPEVDLVVLAPVLPVRKRDALKLSDKISKVGDSIYSVGHHEGFRFSAFSGMVSALERTLPSLPSTPLLQLAVFSAEGASGSPILSDRGEVLGMLVSADEKGFLGFAVPSAILKKFATECLTRLSMVEGLVSSQGHRELSGMIKARGDLSE